MLSVYTANLGLLLSDRRENSAKAFFSWILIGLVAGFITSKLLNKTGHGRFQDVLLGIVGGLIGGFSSNLFRDSGVMSLNLYCLFVALAGAVIFITIYHARSIVGDVRARSNLRR